MTEDSKLDLNRGGRKIPFLATIKIVHITVLTTFMKLLFYKAFISCPTGTSHIVVLNKNLQNE